MTDNLLTWLLLAQAEATEQAAETTRQAGDSGMAGWQILLWMVVLIGGPFLLGTLIANALRMKDIATRLGFVLLAFTIGLSPFVFQVARGHDWRDAIRLGIDLKGGTNLVFKVDHQAAEKEITPDVMDRMVGAVSRRINPSGTEEVTVRQVGSDRVEVIVPGADPQYVGRIKNVISRLGSLEFAVLANTREHRQEIEEARNLPLSQKDVRRGGRVVASWREVAMEPDGTPKVQARPEELSRPGRIDENGRQVLEILVALEPEDRRVTGKYLIQSNPTTDQNGALAVAFRFNAQGARRFYSLTQKYGPERDFHHNLAILLDGQIHSAPRINEPISDSGIISGRFTRAEVDELVNVLNAGALEVPLIQEPVSEYTVGPTLAADVQTKGITAILLAGGAVVVFMLIYYLVAGVIADLCLVLNIALIMGVMSIIDATFTLPGLAGIVLTIGMAVDANVLIFERIREENQRGSSLRMSIQNGFAKALSTIVDANVTTLITAVILYLIGTDQVRGFAVTLFIGIVMSLFTVLVFGRLLFDILERKRLIKEVKMLSIVGATRIDFLGKFPILMTISTVVMVVGLGAFFYRGQQNLDIDFTGGTMVTMEFVEPQDRAEIRKVLDEAGFPAVTLEQLDLAAADQATGERGKRFRMRTTLRDVDDEPGAQSTTTAEQTVVQKLNEAFSSSGHELRRVTLQYGEPEALASLEDAAGDGDDASTTERPKLPEGVSDRFAGGHRVELKLSDNVSTIAVADYFTDALEAISTPDGAPKYDQPGSLFEVQGTAASTKEAEAERKYNSMVLLTTSDLDPEDLQKALASMQQTMDDSPLFEEVNSFASSVAIEMQQSAILAILASLVAIVAYIWFRFQRITFGLAAVAALVHDVLITLGMVALCSVLYNQGFTYLGLEDFKINLPMIAAFLTIVGYSLNDTIVIFDRIREIRGKNPAITKEMLNASVNQTLSRTLLTSLTTLIVVVILYALGGEGIHGFAFCMMIGIIVGTYSSIYVASPMLLWLTNRSEAAAKRAAVS